MRMRSFFTLAYTSLIGILVGLQIFLFLRGPGSHVPSSQEAVGTETLEQNPEVEEKKLDFIVNTDNCKIVRMDPFTWSMMIHFKHLASRKKCWNRSISGLRANITNGILRMENTTEVTNFGNCCYRKIHRKDSKKVSWYSDWLIAIEKTCTRIPRNGTILDASFIQYHCKNGTHTITDFAATVLPPEQHSWKTKAKANFWKKNNAPRPPNILLININSISRLHMIRSLPQTRRLALDKSFVELRGYTKSGENLFSNMMSLIAGLPDRDYPCWSQGKELDGCPFIWKKFSHRNYITGLVEDSPYLSIFNFQKIGFLKQPVDYYNRPLMVAAHNHYNISSVYSREITQCLNSGTVFDSMFQYSEDFLKQVAGKVPYFLLTSFKTYSGANANHIHAEDEYFKAFLSEVLTNPNYDGNNTMIILFSTHGGIQFDPDFILRYEDGLPMMLIRLPPSKWDEHPEWNKNLKLNSMLLTTPLDVHATLLQVLDDPERSSAKGLSLLEEIPDRTCKTAGVSPLYCRCGWIPAFSPGQGVSPESEHSTELGHILVTRMNAFLEPVLRKPLCEPLTLREILYVQVLHEGYVKQGEMRVSYIDFLVGFDVYPSEARFEGIVREYANSTRVSHAEITRQSGLDGENYCIGNDKYKPFCSCFEHNLQRRIEKLKRLMKKSAGF